jgi:hypothetical protein
MAMKNLDPSVLCLARQILGNLDVHANFHTKNGQADIVMKDLISNNQIKMALKLLPSFRGLEWSEDASTECFWLGQIVYEGYHPLEPLPATAVYMPWRGCAVLRTSDGQAPQKKGCLPSSTTP